MAWLNNLGVETTDLVVECRMTPGERFHDKLSFITLQLCTAAGNGLFSRRSCSVCLISPYTHRKILIPLNFLARYPSVLDPGQGDDERDDS